MQLKCLKPSPDGRHIACGDVTGRVAIYDTESSDEINQFQAHEQEVVSLDYCPFVNDNGAYILASGSRDRHTHFYSSDNSYEYIDTLEGHSSSIVKIRFAFDKSEPDESKRLKLITAGADKTILFRKVENYKDISIFHKEVLKNNKIASMDVQNNKLVCGHDKMVTVTHIPSRTRVYEKKAEKLRGSGTQDTYTHVALDQSETFLITSSTDKHFSLQDMLSGSIVFKGTCGDTTTCAKISMDNRYLITASSEGCIYFWRLNDGVTKSINQRMKEMGIPLPELATFRMPSLIMPEYEKPSKIAKIPTVTEDKSSKNIDKLTSPSKVLFAGKSPGEILMEKNRERKLEQSNQKDNLKAQDPFEDMTKSQIKREEVKNIVGEINDVLCGIDEIFTPNIGKKSNPINEIIKPKPEVPVNSQKAELDDELGVATGIVPDWANTHFPPSAPQTSKPKAKPIDYDQRDNIDILNQIELTNAESGISIQPEPSHKAPFTVEEYDQHESSPNNKNDEVVQEDDEDYNENNDPFFE